MRFLMMLAMALCLGAAAAVAQDTAAPAAPAAEITTAAPAAETATSAPATETAAPAPQEPPMDAQMRKAKADYEAAIKNLTPEQLEALGTLEKEFAATVETDMKILFRSAEMEHCLRTDRFFKVDKDVNVRHFLEWRKKLRDAQTKEQTAHRIKRQQYKYVPLKVLNEYYIYQHKMLVMAGKRMVFQQLQSGAYNATNCDELASRLKSGE